MPLRLSSADNQGQCWVWRAKDTQTTLERPVIELISSISCMCSANYKAGLFKDWNHPREWLRSTWLCTVESDLQPANIWLFCPDMCTGAHSMEVMICGDSYASAWGLLTSNVCVWISDSSYRPEPVTRRAWSCALMNSEYVIRVCRGFRTENALSLLPCSQSQTLCTYT